MSDFQNTMEIINFIHNAEKQTPVKVTIKGNFKNTDFDGVKYLP